MLAHPIEKRDRAFWREGICQSGRFSSFDVVGFCFSSDQQSVFRAAGLMLPATAPIAKVTGSHWQFWGGNLTLLLWGCASASKCSHKSTINQRALRSSTLRSDRRAIKVRRYNLRYRA